VAAVDDKIVAISFESAKFEQGVNKAIQAIDKLKKSLSFPDAGKGLSALSDAFKRFKLGNIGKGVDEVSHKLQALRLVGIGVLANLTAGAVRAGARFVKALTLDPIIQGYHEYETKLTAIQTILANTHAAGTKLKDVTKALNELNTYADKTIYNFSEMTRNVGTFTAAGVDLKTAVASIKGIANLAAVSGSNAEQASTAMYQLSQAISAGTVKLQDWNSVVNAGMGGTLFQRALADTAQHMGTLKKGAVTLSGAMKTVTINGESFRQSLASAGPGKKSWLTGAVLTTTLKQLSGDMSDAELKAKGYTDAQVKAIQTQAKLALEAATQVKTLSQLLDTTKEAIGSGWAQTWEIIFGNFGEAKTLFTGLAHAIGGFVSANANARNKVLGDWKALGGRTILISALKQAFHDLAAIIKPIKLAFRDIFPPATGKSLLALTVRFKQLTQELKPSPRTIDNLRRTFRGLFALLDIGKQIISGIFTVFGQLFHAVGAGNGSFLNFTGNIGDFLVALDKALKKGDALHNFFVKMGEILIVPIKLLAALRDALLNLFAGFSPGGISGQLDSVTKSMTPLQRVIEAVANAWSNFVSGFDNTGKILQPAIDGLVKVIQGLGPAINSALSNMNFEAILSVVRTGLFGALVLMFKQFLGKGSLAQQLGGIGGGLLGNIAGSFKALEGSMVALQQNIKAKTLKEIAIAVALLSLSIVALSFVDPKRLNAALAAIAIAFAQLLGAMAIMDKIGKSGGFIKMPVIAASMILLAGAIDVLALAVIGLSRLSWNELIKGLGAIGFLLTALSVAAGPLGRNSAGLIRAGIGISAMAIALNILAVAVKKFGGMSIGTLAKGLGAVAIGLTLIGLAMKLMPPNLLLTGAGLIAVAAGLRIITTVVAKFGAMDWRTIGKGMVGLAGSLVIIAAAMQLMPANMLVTAAGLIVVSLALGRIAKAVGTFGGMSITEIAKGLGTLAASLAILTVALYAMSGTLAGAAALTVAAAGLALLAPALVILGKQSWTQIIKGLIALAAVFTVIGVAATLLSPAIPAMLGFGAALVLIGAGLALAGAGVALIGIGLSAIAVAAPTAVGVIVQAFVQLQKGIVQNAKLLVLGLLQIVEQIAKVAPKLVDALIKILGAVFEAVPKLAPQAVVAITALLDAIVKVLQSNQGKLIQAGFDLLLALLQGIKNNIAKVVSSVVDIISKFLAAIASNINRIVAAGARFVLSLVRGIANNYVKIITAALDIVSKFLGAIASSYGKIIAAGLSIITKLVTAIANNLGKVIRAGTDAVVAFINGVGSAGPRIITAATNAIIKFINALQKNANKLADAGGKAIIAFLNGIATTIDQQAPQMRQAGFNVGVAIVDGMSLGLASKAAGFLKKAGDFVGSAKKKLEFWRSSPFDYGKYLGQSIILGLTDGIDASAPGAYAAAAEISNGTIKTFNDIFQTASPSKVMQQIGQYVGQGFAKGLRGSRDDIKGAFQDLNNQLSKAVFDARQIIASDRAKIAAEEKQPKKKQDKSAIREANQDIANQEALIRRLTAARKESTIGLAKEEAQLLRNKSQWAKLKEQLDGATQALEDAKRARDDAISGFKEQYSTLPDIIQEVTDAEGNIKPLTGAEQLAQYEAAIAHQAAAVGAYQSTLQQLRKLGLDDATYQKLLQEGTADQQFATALLAGGKTAVQGLNKLDAELIANATKLANNAGNNLYQAGVDAAQGLVDGLTSKISDIEKAMEKIATAMVRAIKKKLKIKSPSEIFAGLGQESMAGMAQGVSDSTKMVTDAVDAAAQNALTQMQESMSSISDLLAEEITNPVITPILDLTQIKGQVGELSNIIPITAAVSFGQASAISAAQTTAAEQTNVAPGGTSVKFEQNNYSPEALSSIEIYRQTKNSLSLIKSALGVT
jgi:tape measure domain-containing protein